MAATYQRATVPSTGTDQSNSSVLPEHYEEDQGIYHAGHKQTPHHPSNKLEDQAASAALHVTKGKGSSTNSRSVLDGDGKLSSASAAMSLKYARPQDLPSFPSAGLNMASAGAAASLAESNKKPFEYWKPDSIPAANKAALLAHDYEMDPLWQPEASAAGSSAAGQAMNMKMPVPITDRNVNADGRRKALLAATGAMAGSRRRADSAPIKPEPDNSWALGAATKSHRGTKQNAAYFGSGDKGFEAARIQNVKGNVNPQMYGSNPPVALEVEEKNRQDTLRASAVAMAQKMYAIQQSHIDEAKGVRRSEGQSAAREMHRRGLSDGSDIVEEPTVTPNQYHNLEEQARKLAMERLAKIHDEHAEYRNYYGQSTPPRSRLSMRGRRRSSSDGGQWSNTDEEQSKKIRTQMSMFQSKLAAVDGKKRQGDRDALMAAAQKNVAARMATLDDKVFQETGKSSPQQQEAWENEARLKAQADSDERMIHHGKVHIGGGKYLDQSAVDDIARARLQPTLDEISHTAEQRRARDEEMRLEQEKQKRDADTEKARLAEIKADNKRARDTEKQEEKARKAELKAEENARKQEDQSRRTEEKRVQNEAATAEKEKLRAARDENRKSKDGKGRRLGGLFGGGSATGGVATASAEPTLVATETDPVVTSASAQPVVVEPVTLEPAVVESATVEPLEPTTSALSDTHFITTLPNPEEAAAYDEPAQAIEVPLSTTHDPATVYGGVAEQPHAVESNIVEPVAATTAQPDTTPWNSSMASDTPASRTDAKDSKVKSWLRSRFRGSSKPQNSVEDEGTKPGFIGGAALTGAAAGESSPDRAKSDSVREVAMAGKSVTNDTEDMYGSSEKGVSGVNGAAVQGAGRSPSISDLSNSDLDETAPRGRRGFKERLLGKSATKDSADEHDEFEEARDTFEEEKLTPPPHLAAATTTSTKSGDSPSRERSKFIENL